MGRRCIRSAGGRRGTSASRPPRCWSQADKGPTLPEKFATWLFTIARRVSMNGRRKPRLQATADYGDAPANARSPLENLMEKDDRRYLWEVARRVLSEPEQTALWLHYVEEMPLADIAIVLGRSSAAVKTAMFRARKRLLPHLQVLGPTDAAVRGSDARVEDANSWAAPLEARHA